MPETLINNYTLKSPYQYFKIFALLLFTTISCNINAQKANGHQVNYYITGAKQSEGNYKNSLQDSTWRYYYPNGKINRITNYDKGVKNGRSITYNKDGSLASDVNYKNGNFFGAVKFYYSNGQLNYEEYYDANSLEQGEFKLWYKSGKLSQDGMMVNGKLVGKWMKYYENGQTEHTAYYDTAGNKDSLWLYYSPSGKLMGSEKYKADSLLKTTIIDTVLKR
jgi:antitoxin component YwqK of YwqJK toxin-antitoxin module